MSDPHSVLASVLAPIAVAAVIAEASQAAMMHRKGEKPSRAANERMIETAGTPKNFVSAEFFLVVDDHDCGSEERL